MNQEDLKRLKIWFDEYVSGYYTDDSGYNYPFRLKKIIQSVYVKILS